MDVKMWAVLWRPQLSCADVFVYLTCTSLLMGLWKCGTLWT